MDPEARRFMWSVIHKMSTKGRKSSVIMTTHSMDEAETLCKRMGIMVNGEFVCMGKANQIKDKYGFGYEADVRIKPMTEEQKNEIYEKYNYPKNTLVTEDNINNILSNLNKLNYLKELKEGRLGERIKREMDLNGNIHIDTLLNWLFFVENAIKFIIKGKNYFDEIIISEHIENNFLFKMKKEQTDKSIGFFFGLFEESKESCYVTEYSIQKTSLEQIFNKFAASQGKTKEQMNEQENEVVEESKNIVVDDDLINKLLK
jgi:ATP-binding cassette subfamily A (ABC1) protein 3